MSLTIHPEVPPLALDQAGVCRVSGTRVTLEVILHAFRQGQAPTEIAESYPTVPLADIYAVIAYCLKHREEVDAYLQEAEREAAETRQQTETRFPLHELRQRVRAQRKPVSA